MSKRVLRERRYCTCGCSQTFECRITSTREFYNKSCCAKFSGLGKLNKGKSPWNKGLTKDTDERVKRYGENGKITRRPLYNSGVLRGHNPNPLFGKDNKWCKLNPNYKKTREKQIKTCLNRYGVENPGSTLSKCFEYYSHYAGLIKIQSSYEKRAADILDILCDSGIFSYYDRYTKKVTDYLDINGDLKRYYTDFKVVDWNGNYFYLDPKNDYKISLDSEQQKIREVIKQNIALKILNLREIELLEGYITDCSKNNSKILDILRA